jgi:hypothetical protein
VVTKLAELIAAEATNFKATTKHLGTSLDLVNDVESLYEKMSHLLKSPGGNLDTSDELVTVMSIMSSFVISVETAAPSSKCRLRIATFSSAL